MDEKIPIIPADPMEAASMPIKGVDVPEDEDTPEEAAKKAAARKPYPEDEGLAPETSRDAHPDAAADAARRGH
jgi:hypothetical protein